MIAYFGSKGSTVYAADLDDETGVLSAARAVGDATRPGFLALHPSGNTLYIVELGDESTDDDRVGSYSIDADTGNLTRLNYQPSFGENPTHLAVSPDGKTLVVAKYSGGSVTSYPIQADGRLGEKASHFQHEGSSIDPDRQTKPFAHGVAFSTTGTTVFIADLGIDKVLIYDLDPTTSVMSVARQSCVETTPGGGPRHLAVHANGKWVYVCNEMKNSVEVLVLQGEDWVLTKTVSTIPSDFAGSTSTAEIFLDPLGQFLYVSNRGHDTAAVFSVDPESGALTTVEYAPVRVGEPRGMWMAPSGRYVIACGQKTDLVEVLAVDAKTGALSATAEPVAVPDSPICVVFLSR